MPRPKKEVVDQEVAVENIAIPEAAEGTTKEKTNKKPCKVKNLARANQTVFGVTGEPIVFDADGIAQPNEADLEHLLKVPGYEGV
jgi:hypothetical protein